MARAPGMTGALVEVDRSLAVVDRSSSQATGPVRFGGCAEVEPLRSPAERGRLSKVGSLRRSTGGGVPGRAAGNVWEVPALAHPPTRFAASTGRKPQDQDTSRRSGLARPSSPHRDANRSAVDVPMLDADGPSPTEAARPRCRGPRRRHPRLSLHRDTSLSQRGDGGPGSSAQGQRCVAPARR